MTKKTSHLRRETQEAVAFVDALRGETMKGGTFDSAAAKNFIDTATCQATSAPVPKALQAVFDEADSKDISKISRAILDGANAYERMHGTRAPGDLLEQAMHLAGSTTRASRAVALDSIASSDAHAATSLQPNRAVVAILTTLSEAIPFAHYLPADIGSNEARLAIMTHQAGSDFGAYGKGGLMDGVSSGGRYIGTGREHKCVIAGADITGKITAIRETDDTCKANAPAVPLLKGRAIVYVNGLISATESPYNPGNIGGKAEIAGVTYNISGTIDNTNGNIALVANPPLPADTEVVVEAFIDYEQDDTLTPRVITEVETFTLYANPYRVITTQTVDSRMQMSNELGLDPYSEGVIAIQGQFANERHYEVLRKARRMSARNQ
ncbi:MAG: hypothetical protein ACRC9N_08695, partial [Aeromonas sp.]